MAVIWLFRRHALTGGALGFANVSDELAADCIAKGIAQVPRPPFKHRDFAWPDAPATGQDLGSPAAPAAADLEPQNSAPAAADLGSPGALTDGQAPRRRGRPRKES